MFFFLKEARNPDCCMRTVLTEKCCQVIESTYLSEDKFESWIWPAGHAFLTSALATCRSRSLELGASWQPFSEGDVGCVVRSEQLLFCGFTLSVQSTLTLKLRAA